MNRYDDKVKFRTLADRKADEKGMLRNRFIHCCQREFDNSSTIDSVIRRLRLDDDVDKLMSLIAGRRRNSWSRFSDVADDIVSTKSTISIRCISWNFHGILP